MSWRSVETTNNDFLLEVNNIKTHFYCEEGIVKAVDGVDLRVKSGEVLGLVGESGCGKSVTALSILRLINSPGKIIDGDVIFDGKQLFSLNKAEMQAIRGNRISMIFQQPQSSLNPVFTIGNQLAEVFRTHSNMGKKEAINRSIELMRLVEMPDPEKKIHSYPHQLSGGQAQRVMIAMALALKSQLLIADEPTTALDVTIQAQILNLMRGLTKKIHSAVILITHDLGVIAETSDYVAVMYAGKIVETTNVVDLFRKPLHPYTRDLMKSIPVLGAKRNRLEVIPGSVPNLINLPPGCRFANRCRERIKYNLSICNQTIPDLDKVLPGHSVRCWLYQDFDGHKAPLKDS
ncbi:MAG: ABC transporter ATP-binding protein [Anaerolineales bacterium]|nr:ABC transporter ATP-binding protein [Anaerolineales bacterium]